MKKIIIAASTILLIGGGITYTVTASSDPVMKPVEKMVIDEEVEKETNEVKEINVDMEQMEEYEQIVKSTGIDNPEIKVVKDNKKQRVSIIFDEKGNKQWKSVYVKKKERLKIVEFDGGLVFNEIIGETKTKHDHQEQVEKKEEPKQESAPVVKEEPKQESAPVVKEEAKQESAPVVKEEPKKETAPVVKEEPKKEAAPVAKEEAKKEVKKSTDGRAEFATLGAHVDVDSFKVNVVEDNPYKRIVLLEDEHGKPRYKSIYSKKSNHLKIINLRGGLVFQGKI